MIPLRWSPSICPTIQIERLCLCRAVLSKSALARLNATIGVTTQGDSTRCGPADVAAYDATLKDLLMGVQTGRADVETMANVSALRALAQSVAPLP
jgi:hypothetical protein